MIRQGARQPPPRSLLFVPGDRAVDLLPKAVRGAPDAIILDLEDGVRPDRRDAARRTIRAAVDAIPVPLPLYVRTNGPGSADVASDLVAIADLRLAGIVLPKCERPNEVRRFAETLSAHAPPGLGIIALLETPIGILGAAAIAEAHPAVVGLGLGAEDLALRMGMRRTATATEILVARSLVVLAAAAGGVWAVDTPSLDLVDIEAVERDARTAADLGFSGKFVVHPSQIPAIHAAFEPHSEDLAAARAILEHADASGSGAGAGSANERMIDRPVIEAARRTVKKADRTQGGSM